MKLLSETELIMREVDSVTGWPVEIVYNSDQPLMARMTRAHAGLPAHILQVDPNADAPDYLIVYQCGFILRLFEQPVETRTEFAIIPDRVLEVERMLKKGGLTAGLPDMALAEIAQELYGGLMRQLRSYPIGLRIDRWIFDTYEVLHDQQKTAIARQHQDNLSVLEPAIKDFSPKPIYEANASMNAAYAVFSERLFGKSGYAIPWRSAGFEKRAHRLLKIMEEVPEAAINDPQLVDAWATDLGIANWYQWVAARP